MIEFASGSSKTTTNINLHIVVNQTCYRNIRYRLLPGATSKARRLFGLAGACRFVWNHFLAQNQEAYKLHQEDCQAQACGELLLPG
ncbi:MAG: hypothetical protein TH68_09665 [Candidatus Synechococcus spongiarum 142]|uniref:Transposase putative helix-turn-helix domain-containing protein n=1 Tax=Candidatus Synechococcus spongiarum 142 TaxID=1608213 RepID=A0A6N3X267_9SYNE|nr:MAG: hypothetical protein TH68_09665 [Candidatus Synechococcus spongiarum 142]